jgi:hypothetical protein
MWLAHYEIPILAVIAAAAFLGRRLAPDSVNRWANTLLAVTALLFFGLARRSHGAAAGWLALASLFFYGWWNWIYVPLLIASTAFNYLCGVNLARQVRAGETGAAKALLGFAVTANLLLLGYYKYAPSSTSGALGARFGIGQIVCPRHLVLHLPQIVFWSHPPVRARVQHSRPVCHLFSHLIAGLILHKEMIQFRALTYRLNLEDVAVGLTIFFIGCSEM